MKKNKLTIMIIFAIMMLCVNVYAQQMNSISNQKSPGSANSHINKINVQVDADARVRKCIDLLHDKIGAEEDVCTDIIQDREKCIDYLESENITNPERICNSFTDNSWLVDKTTGKVDAWKIRTIKRTAKKNPNVKKIVKSLTPAQTKKLLALSRKQRENIINKNINQIKNQLNKYELKKINAKEFYKLREIAENKIQFAKKRYMEAKKNYIKAKKNYLDSKQAFNKAIKSGDDESAKTYAKEFLTELSDMIIKSLEKIKYNIESNDDINNEDAEEMINDIDDMIESIEQAKKDLESAETKEEIKKAGKKITDSWKRIKYRAKFHAGIIINSKVMDVLKRSERLEIKLEKTLARLEEQGYDVTGVDDLVDEFSEKLLKAETKFNQGKEKFQAAKNLTIKNSSDKEINELIQEGNELVQKAHVLLREAHKILIEIIRTIKDVSPELDLEDNEEEYEVLVENES
ncbi:hypothetical protein GF327_02785 [Candidatus Woesearchaeota archaeon]|nr:hypothetical protein [Candidatus Woesearchaeota archaeon]